jgi:predicted ester cyclase
MIKRARRDGLMHDCSSGTEIIARGKVRMENPNSLEIAARNKRNYLKAKAAFNAKDLEACILQYSPDHQIKSRPCERGRHEIQRFLESLHENWTDLQVIVEHAVAEDNWVMGRSRSVATHSKIVLGVQPTNKVVEATFWDLHRFDDSGLIVETWNLMDNMSIMQQLGLMGGGT